MHIYGMGDPIAKQYREDLLLLSEASSVILLLR